MGAGKTGAHFFEVRVNFIDRLICDFDQGLRTLAAMPYAQRPTPANEVTNSSEICAQDKAQAVRLMRVNHCGEICAQALYQGQALMARDPSTRKMLLQAAREENDHLAWCQQRLDDLGGKKSALNLLWYAGSFGFGVVSGALGDKWSMGFLVETERQVEHHLDDHLALLAVSDIKSRRVLEAMREDEIRHGNSGEQHGAMPLPQPIVAAMHFASRLMTRTAYWV